MPRAARRLTSCNQRKCRRGKIVVFEERDLERENGFSGSVSHFPRQHREGHLGRRKRVRSEEHTSELQSRSDLVCRLLLEKKKQKPYKLFIILSHLITNNSPR